MKKIIFYFSIVVIFLIFLIICLCHISAKRLNKLAGTNITAMDYFLVGDSIKIVYLEKGKNK